MEDKKIVDSTPKKGNRELMVKMIEALKNGPLTRDQLKIKLHVPRTTVFDAARELIKEKIIKKGPLYIESQDRGRPKMIYTLLTEEEKKKGNDKP